MLLLLVSCTPYCVALDMVVPRRSLRYCRGCRREGGPKVSFYRTAYVPSLLGTVVDKGHPLVAHSRPMRCCPGCCSEGGAKVRGGATGFGQCSRCAMTRGPLWRWIALLQYE